jgi:hypothetical protein
MGENRCRDLTTASINYFVFIAELAAFLASSEPASIAFPEIEESFEFFESSSSSSLDDALLLDTLLETTSVADLLLKLSKNPAKAEPAKTKAKLQTTIFNFILFSSLKNI